MRKLIILGASGSIGTQTLDIIRENKKDFQIVGLSLGHDLDKAKKIIDEFKPEMVCLRKKADLDVFKEYKNIQFVYGDDGLKTLATYKKDEDVYLEVALVGYVGLIPTIEAIKIKRNILLANKETLVMAGDFVMQLAKDNGVNIFPIDSEHSAIYQCLVGENKKDIKRLIITASGGAFRDKDITQLPHLKKEDALNHPNWLMGEKITIDCATMMNKGFEVIEAHHLYDIPYNQIDVLLHWESIIHSLVEFHDSSVKAQLGNPDMRIPISYALYYPNRAYYQNQLELIGKKLTFEKVDYQKYPCFKLALEAANKGNIFPTVLNAANEAAVKLYLENKIKFTDIYEFVKAELDEANFIDDLKIEDIIKINSQVFERVYRKVK